MPQFSDNLDTPNYGDDTMAQMELKRKLKLAQALQDQTMPQGQMIGNQFVAPSIFQYLGNLAGRYVGAQREKQAINDYGQYQKGRQAKYAELLAEPDNAKFTQNLAQFPEYAPDLIKARMANMNKEEAQTVVPAGSTVLKGGVPIYTAPKETKEPEMFGKINLSDFTPESLNAFAQSSGKDYSLLKPITKPQSPTNMSPIGRLYEERDAIAKQNPNDPRLKKYDAMINKTVTYANQQPYQVGDDAIDYAAEIYRSTGNMPALGQGSAQLRTKILDRAATLNKNEGVPQSEAAINLASKKAAQGTLLQLQKQSSMVKAFEINARKNGEMALNLSEKVDRTGSPIFNKWLQAGQKSVAGNPDVSAFNAANETFVNEYAKIMSGSMGNTPVSDAARAHAHQMLSTAQTKEQYRAVMNVLKQEMGNRIQGLDEEVASTRNLLNPQNKAMPTTQSKGGWKIEKVPQ